MGRAPMVALPGPKKSHTSSVPRPNYAAEQHVAVVAEAGRNPNYDVDQTMDCAPVEEVAEAAPDVGMHRALVKNVAEAATKVPVQRCKRLLPLPDR